MCVNVQEISPGSHVYSAQRLDDQDLSAVLITLLGLPPLILQRPQAPSTALSCTHTQTHKAMHVQSVYVSRTLCVLHIQPYIVSKTIIFILVLPFTLYPQRRVSVRLYMIVFFFYVSMMPFVLSCTL